MNESFGENFNKKPDLSEEKPKGRRICGWCGKYLGPSEMEGDTHGICTECHSKFLEELEPKK